MRCSLLHFSRKFSHFQQPQDHNLWSKKHIDRQKNVYPSGELQKRKHSGFVGKIGGRELRKSGGSDAREVEAHIMTEEV